MDELTVWGLTIAAFIYIYFKVGSGGGGKPKDDKKEDKGGKK